MLIINYFITHFLCAGFPSKKTGGWRQPNFLRGKPASYNQSECGTLTFSWRMRTPHSPSSHFEVSRAKIFMEVLLDLFSVCMLLITWIMLFCSFNCLRIYVDTLSVVWERKPHLRTLFVASHCDFLSFDSKTWRRCELLWTRAVDSSGLFFSLINCSRRAYKLFGKIYLLKKRGARAEDPGGSKQANIDTVEICQFWIANW